MLEDLISVCIILTFRGPLSSSLHGASSTSVPLYRCLQYLPVKGRIALSNDVCLRSERYQAQEYQAAFGAYCLSLQFLRRIVYCRAYPQKCDGRNVIRIQSVSSSIFVVKSCQEPRTRPESSYDGSYPIGPSVDRRLPPMRRIALGCFINLSGFAMPSHKMLGQNEMDPAVAALHWKL